MPQTHQKPHRIIRFNDYNIDSLEYNHLSNTITHAIIRCTDPTHIQPTLLLNAYWYILSMGMLRTILTPYNNHIDTTRLIHADNTLSSDILRVPAILWNDTMDTAPPAIHKIETHIHQTAKNAYAKQRNHHQDIHNIRTAIQYILQEIPEDTLNFPYEVDVLHEVFWRQGTLYSNYIDALHKNPYGIVTNLHIPHVTDTALPIDQSTIQRITECITEESCQDDPTTTRDDSPFAYHYQLIPLKHHIIHVPLIHNLSDMTNHSSTRPTRPIRHAPKHIAHLKPFINSIKLHPTPKDQYYGQLQQRTAKY